MALRSHPFYRVLPEPANDAAHAGCYLSGSRGPCVDTGINIYGEGTLTISLNSLRELCEIAGYSFNEEGAKLEEDNAHLQRELAEARDLISAYEDQLNAVGVAVARAAGKLQ